MDLLPVIKSLRQNRPVFHSEADFQFALAWDIKLEYSDAKIRLEVPCGTSVKGRVDIVVRFDSAVIPIELKYLRKRQSFNVNGEQFNLIDGVHDMHMHDCIKDVSRLETFRSQMSGFLKGYSIWLTNDAAYWDPNYYASYYSEFHAPQASVKSGMMSFQAGAKLNTNPQYESPITLTGTYDVDWHDYSDLGTKNGQFKFALFKIY